MKNILNKIVHSKSKATDCDGFKKRTSECSECNIMANYEDPDKWDGVRRCPKCGKDTEILKRAWD